MSKKNNRIYVIGHVNPDTDSIAAAMGYAWLLQDQSSDEVIAARAGQLNLRPGLIRSPTATTQPHRNGRYAKPGPLPTVLEALPLSSIPMAPRMVW